MARILVVDKQFDRQLIAQAREVLEHSWVGDTWCASGRRVVTAEVKAEYL